MATLEKIRQRKKILAIVIGLALLAFIVEAGVEAAGRMAGKTSAAKVGSEKIDIVDFQNRVAKVSAQEQQNGDNGETDPAVRQQQVLEEMINDALLNQEYKKVGIDICDWEISQLMLGKTPHPAVMQFVQQAGAKTPEEFYEFIMNPGKQGVAESDVAQLRQQWSDLQEEVSKEYKFSKLQMLMAGCMQPNDLERKQMAEEEAITNVVTFAKKDYSSLPDDQFKVSDAELKAEWEKMKPMFKIDEEMRNIHFIAVPIQPSPADIAEANTIADAAYIALQKGVGVDSVRLLGTVNVDTAKVLQKDIPAKARDYFTNAPVGSTLRDSVMNNRHTMYKLINKGMSLDSVQLSFVVVQGDAKLQKDVMDQLNAGKTLDDLKKTYPQKVEGNLNQWQRIYMVADSMKAKIANAQIGNYFVLNSGENGAQLVAVNEKKPANLFYTVATVTYDAYASAKTIDELTDKFQAFLNKNKTAADFEKNAAAAGYNAAEMLISPSQAQLSAGPFGQGIKDTRKVIKWAFDSKKGEVSPIFNDNKDMLVAVALDDIYSEGYLPYTFPRGKEMLTRRIINDKKGDALVAQYKGKASDLNGYAKLMGAQVDTANVVFAAASDPKLGNEPGLIGRMSAAKQGQLKGPWKGLNAVYVYQVVRQDKAERQPSKEELNQRYSQTRGAGIYANPNYIFNILSKATKVERHLIKFN